MNYRHIFLSLLTFFLLSCFDKKLILVNNQYKHDTSAIDENSRIQFAKEYSKSYLRYLFQINEIFGIRIATLINIAYYFDLMKQIRFEINNDTFVKWSKDYLDKHKD